MKHALTLLAPWLISMAACAVESGTQTTEDLTSSALSTELAVSSPESTSGIGPITQSVTCDRVWECDPICGTWVNGVLVRFPTNVLHEYCSDGSDTVVQTHPCGEVCF